MKCPYCRRNDTVDEEPNSEPTFCIQLGSLSITHPYYAQIQTQMNVCNRKYCDFFLWAKKDYFCQRVMLGKDTWKAYVGNGVLPEIIGKYFTCVPIVTVYDNNDESQFCYC